ncbi:MAG: Hpt domain-containing protein [Alphaproteobacteria bacterium]
MDRDIERGFMIDWARIQELHEEIGAEAFAEVIDLFLLEIDSAVESIRTSPDQERLEMTLHFLKGGVLNLGFTEMATLCHEGERLAAQGRSAQVDVDAILLAYQSARHCLVTETGQRIGQ